MIRSPPGNDFGIGAIAEREERSDEAIAMGAGANGRDWSSNGPKEPAVRIVSITLN
jgi:hypothetical protein